MNIIIGEGRNNFIIEFNENRTEEDDLPVITQTPADCINADESLTMINRH